MCDESPARSAAAEADHINAETTRLRADAELSFNYGARRENIRVVFDLESDPPQALGNYVRTDEDTVIYRRPAGDNGYASYDCVQVVSVDLFPVNA